MLIKSVSLKDIKSYREATVDFQWGTNAISGENGAGKSTILEAIGYALFDYKPYKIENMVRHGQKKGEIRVVFTGKDEREYEIVRTIRKKGGTSSYYIHDLRLGGNIADSKHHGKEGVLTALRKDILDMNLGTGLQTLFEDVIGVPQGTIITPFLDTPALRKEKFDPILGIDEYKRAYEKTGEIRRIIEKKRNGLENENASISGKLEAYDETVVDHQKVTEEIGTISISIEKKTGELKNVETRKSILESREKEIQKGESRVRELKAKADGAREREHELETSLTQAREAAIIVKASEPDYIAYVKSEETLKELEEKRTKRDEIQKEEQGLLRREAALKERISSLEKDLTGSADELEKLPKVSGKLEAQKKLEEQKKEIEHAILAKKERLSRVRKLEKDCSLDLKKLQEIRERLREREVLQERSGRKKELEEKLHGLKSREVSSRTQIEHYQKSRENLGSGSCPFFNEPCPKITGEASDLFRDEEKGLNVEIKWLWSEIAEINVGIQDSVKAQKALQNLNILVGREKALEESTEKTNGEIDQLKTLLAGGKEEEDLAGIMNDLKETGDHRGEYLRLQKVKEQRPLVEKEFSEKQLSLTELKTSLGEIGKRLETYVGLDEKRKECEQKRRGHKKGYDTYASHKKESEKVEDLTGRLSLAKKESKAITGEISALEESLTKLKQDFNRKELETLTGKYNELNHELGAMKGSSDELKRREKQLEREIERLEGLKRKQEMLGKQLRLETFSAELMNHIRDILKKTPGHLRRRYVAAISQDANNRFHELMGDNTVDITWDEDYGISMRKGKNTIEFRLLSG